MNNSNQDTQTNTHKSSTHNKGSTEQCQNQPDSSKPNILSRRIVAETALFTVESVELEFNTQVKRTYERLVPGGAGAVMIAAITDHQELILIREYAVGIEDYVLTLPGGKIDLGESLESAANRELIEEVGLGANSIDFLKKVNLNPRYARSSLNLVLAYDLYQNTSLEGDEPEPLEVIKWPLNRLHELLWRDDFNEGRAMAGVILAIDRFKDTERFKNTER